MTDISYTALLWFKLLPSHITLDHKDFYSLRFNIPWRLQLRLMQLQWMHTITWLRLHDYDDTITITWLRLHDYDYTITITFYDYFTTITSLRSHYYDYIITITSSLQWQQVLRCVFPLYSPYVLTSLPFLCSICFNSAHLLCLYVYTSSLNQQDLCPGLCFQLQGHLSRR